MVYNAADSPNLSSVTDMSGMFSSSSFNGNISEWDVSSVTNMSYMFLHSSFNGNISGWDVSSVTDMSYMFVSSPFNGDISNWNVSSVTDMSIMFGGSPFNGDISNWNVSSVTDMSGMFSDSPFNDNLGSWYITLDNTSIAGIPGTVGNIAAQNKFLAAQGPAYGIGSGSDSEHFEINGTELIMISAPDDSPATVNITSTGGFGTSNSRIFEITFTPIAAPDNISPGIASIERSSPIAQITDSQMLVYRVTFSEDVMGVNTSDFVLSPDSTGGSGTNPVTGISGSGSVYYVTVSATQDGTYNIDLISSGHGIADAAGNPLTNTLSVGADSTYTVATF